MAVTVNETADNRTNRQQVASSNIPKDPHSSGPCAKSSVKHRGHLSVPSTSRRGTDVDSSGPCAKTSSSSSSLKHRCHLSVPSTSHRGTDMDFLAPPRALDQRNLGKKCKKREFTHDPLSEGTSHLARESESTSTKPSSTKDLAPRISTIPPGRATPTIRNIDRL